jgi:DNA-directed RNA polymerase specialized sigma24 family protein
MPGIGDPTTGDRVPAAGVADATVARDFAEWLERVRATFEAVQYTCAHRLADPTLAEQVSVQVVAGMVSRPGVFRYFGLPYSGRIARLAEARIAEADAGDLTTVCRWSELRDRLVQLPDEHREALVVSCVRGGDIGALAEVLSCAESVAASRNEAMLRFMKELARPGLAPAPDPDERG